MYGDNELLIKLMYNKKIILETAVTQSAASVVSLLEYLGRPSNPLPAVIELPGMALVLSNRKDVFYATTPKSCSCPSAVYWPGQKCKHQRKYFAEKSIVRQSIAEELDEHAKNLSRTPSSYQHMVEAAREETEAEPLELKPTGSFKPFLEG